MFLDHKQIIKLGKQKNVWDKNQSNPGKIYKTSLKFEETILYTEMFTYHDDPIKQAIFTSLDEILPILEDRYQNIDIKILSSDTEILPKKSNPNILSEKIKLLTVFDTFWEDPSKSYGQSALDYILEPLSKYVHSEHDMYKVNIDDGGFRILDNNDFDVDSRTLYLYRENPDLEIHKE